MSKIKVGITLYGLTREFYREEMSLEQTIKAVADLGLKDFEVVAAESIPGYPWPTDATIRQIRDWCDKYGVNLRAYSSQGDRGRRADVVDMSLDDMFALGLNDIKFANKFGATHQRQQHNITPEVLRKLAPYAERYNVKVGIEISAGLRDIDSPLLQQYCELFEELQSPYIGFTPDFGIFSTREKEARSDGRLHLMGSLSNVGLSAALVRRFDEAVLYGAEKDELIRDIEAMRLSDHEKAVVYGVLAGEKDDPATLEDFRRMVKYAVHAHGKFHVLREDGDDTKIPTSKVLDIMKEEGYEGYIMIEYEGHGMSDAAAMPILERHINRYRQLLGDDIT